jgi:hypothetical protein
LLRHFQPLAAAFLRLEHQVDAVSALRHERHHQGRLVEFQIQDDGGGNEFVER